MEAVNIGENGSSVTIVAGINSPRMVFVRSHTRFGEIKRSQVDVDGAYPDAVGSCGLSIFLVSEIDPLGN